MYRKSREESPIAECQVAIECQLGARICIANSTLYAELLTCQVAMWKIESQQFADQEPGTK
jgi:hypothetical protein